MIFGRSLLFFSFRSLFRFGNSKFGRTEYTVHVISVGLSLYPLNRLLLSQIEGFRGQVFFNLAISLFKIGKIVDGKVDIDVFGLFFHQIWMVNSFQGITRSIGCKLLPVGIFRVHIMRVDIALLAWSIHLIRHFTDKFMYQKRIVDFLWN